MIIGLGLFLSQRGSGGGASAPFTNRLFASALPNFVAARDGGGRYKVVVIGDSISTNYLTTFAQSWPSVMATRLAALGVPARNDGFDAANAQNPSSDDRITLGSGWGVGNESAGERLENSTTTSTFTFTPAGSVKTFDVYWTDTAAGNAVFTLDIDGGTATTVTGTNDGTVKKATITAASAGTRALNIKRVSGTVYINVVDAFAPATPALNVLDHALSGQTAQNWALATPVYASPIVSVLGGVLTVIMLGVNDSRASRTASQYASDMQTLITRCKAAGDVLLFQQTPISELGISDPEQALLNAALVTLSSTNGVPLLRINDRWGGYAAADAAGFINADHVHITPLGASNIGTWIGTLLAGVGKDTSVTPFVLAPVDDADLSTAYTVATTVSGINAPVDVTISGTGTPLYKINSGSYTSAAGIVVNGDVVTVKVTSPGSGHASVAATLTIGDQSSTYTVTTGDAPWSPLAFGADLNSWWDAADAATVTLSVAKVTTWADKSGNGHDLAQASGGDRPTYSATSFPGSKPGISFAGHYMQVAYALAQPFTRIAILTTDAPGSLANGYYLYGGATDVGGGIYAVSSVSSGTTDLGLFAGGGAPGVGALPVNGAGHVIQGFFNGASSSGRVDGTEATGLNPGTQAAGGMAVGGIYGGFGSQRTTVGEIIEVKRALTSDEQTALAAYSLAKWGV